MSSETTESEGKIFELLAEQKKALERRLLRNILLQLLAAIIAANFLFHFSVKGDEYLNKNLMLEDGLVQFLLVLLFLFLFIEFGFATAKFFLVSSKYTEMTGSMVDSYLKQTGRTSPPKAVKELRSDYRIAFASFTIFDQIIKSHESKHGRMQNRMAVFFVMVIFVVNHVSTFLLIEANLEGDKLWRLITKGLATIIMSFFYFMYLTSESIDRLPVKPPVRLITYISAAFIAYFWINEFIPGIKIPLSSFSAN